MKIATVIGARPQFVKAAYFSRALRKKHTEIIIHTGQHYDKNMSNIFFKELSIPSPKYNLGIGSSLHGDQTGKMLSSIEEILLDESPDWVTVYGDTNSTLAGALAAAKLNIKVLHIEAGLRSFNRKMPEEINRILTDHASDLLFCPTNSSVNNLRQEGIVDGVHLVGDIMYNTLFDVLPTINEQIMLDHLALKQKSYLLSTIHRAENTDNIDNFVKIINAFDQLKDIIIWPVHPRTLKIINQIKWKPKENIKLIDPLGYKDMIALEKNAWAIMTDSGGIQKEAFWLEVPCITLRGETEWVETLENGWNQLTGADTDRIVSAIDKITQPIKTSKNNTNPFHLSHAIDLLCQYS